MPVTRVYAVLLRLYPMDYQVLFADEMAQAFAEAAADHRARGPAVFARFVVGQLRVFYQQKWDRVVALSIQREGIHLSQCAIHLPALVAAVKFIERRADVAKGQHRRLESWFILVEPHHSGSEVGEFRCFLILASVL